MAPVISTLAEARTFARFVRARGVQTVGVVIEVPAAALHTAAILAKVDFVSTGTNDIDYHDRERGLSIERDFPDSR